MWVSQLNLDDSRITFVEGSFFTRPSAVPGGYSTYVLSHVLHDWTDADVIRILGSVKDAMLESSLKGVITKPKLLIVELFLHAKAGRHTRTSSMQLLALANGITRTYEEMCDLVVQAGMKVVKIVEMRALSSVLEVESV
jgi:hypothetical protein